MYPECRHIMTSGKKCQAPALKGTALCYYHTKLHKAAKRKIGAASLIDIPVLEDRCSIQLAIAQVLKALVHKKVDDHRASLLIRGLRLAAQNVDQRSEAIPYKTVTTLIRTRNGEELANEEA